MVYGGLDLELVFCVWRWVWDGCDWLICVLWVYFVWGIMWESFCWSDGNLMFVGIRVGYIDFGWGGCCVR